MTDAVRLNSYFRGGVFLCQHAFWGQRLLRVPAPALHRGSIQIRRSFSFVVTNVPNDVTGNWRIASIAENIEMQDYALDYYKEYFKSDDEIHAIVNFNYKTTTKISVMGNLLDVSVYEYVDKEEHDAKLLFSGMLLKEYHVNKDTGEVEEIQ